MMAAERVALMNSNMCSGCCMVARSMGDNPSVVIAANICTIICWRGMNAILVLTISEMSLKQTAAL
jgi:hypothetical protein